MDNIVYQLTAGELLRAYRRKDLSPVEVLKAVLARIETFNSQVNAFRVVDEHGALAQALEAEARWMRGEPKGRLDGVPISIKDLLLTKGMSTLFGSRTTNPEQPWDEDAPSVARVREQGAIILGKTNTPEFGYKIVTDSPLTGVTRNPWDLTRSPGGSSGGAAVAVAMGMGPLAIGTDAGGSIRIPACWTGTFGLKPTFRRVPAYPSTAFGTLSNVGPITRTVEDAALLMTVIARPDPRDWHALPYDGRDYLIGLESGVHGLRVAYSPDLGIAEVEADIATCVAKAAAVFAELGAHVEEVQPPKLEPFRHVHSVQWVVIVAGLVRNMSPEQRALLDPPLRELAKMGETVTTQKYFEALVGREALGQMMHLFFRGYDLLITPTFHVSAPLVPGLPKELDEAPRLTSWWNQTMQPAASIPCGLTSAGIPVGLQIIGPRYADALVLRACRAYESARGDFSLPPLAA